MSSQNLFLLMVLHDIYDSKNADLVSDLFSTCYFLLCISERRLDQCPDRALLVWSPTTDIPDQKCKLRTYVNLCKLINLYKQVSMTINASCLFQWMSISYWLKRNMVTMENRHWGCYFGISTIWSVQFWIWRILHHFPTNGRSRIKYYLSRRSNFMARVSIAFDKWYVIIYLNYLYLN